MSYYCDNIQVLEKKLIERAREFKGFKETTRDDLEKFKIMVSSRISSNKTDNKLNNYIDVLSFLTCPCIHQIIPSIDDRLLYLIEAVDPELKALKIYLSVDIPTLSDIESAKKEDRELLEASRKNLINKMISSIRNELGFYLQTLISYELAYFNRFLKEKEFLPNNQKKYLNKLLSYITPNLSLDSIDEDSKRRLYDTSIWYKDMTQTQDIQTIAFHIINQNDLLKLQSIQEQLSFLIMNSDKDLNLLRIYEEESRMPVVKKRALEEIGFYDERLILLEKAYKRKFMPDTKLSIWSI